MSAKKIFFQSSMPRAGSTLLQNILGQNPDIYVTPTSGVLELLYGARGNYSDSPEFQAQDSKQMKLAFTSFCKRGLEGFYEPLTDRPYVVDKSRGWGIHYNFLDSFYPDPKVVCMVRSLPDIFASMEKKFRGNQHLEAGIVKHREFKGTTTHKRIQIWENTTPIGMALERLQEIILQGISTKMLFIRYEDLVSQPDATLEKIYKYLQIPGFKHNFKDIQQITSEDDTVYGVYGDHKIGNMLISKPSDAEKVLGSAICNYLIGKYAWYQEFFGYH